LRAPFSSRGAVQDYAHHYPIISSVPFGRDIAPVMVKKYRTATVFRPVCQRLRRGGLRNYKGLFVIESQWVMVARMGDFVGDDYGYGMEDSLFKQPALRLVRALTPAAP
jgi:hypothetical protein